MNNYEKEYKRWLESDKLTEQERAELVSIASDEEAKALRFTAPMDFGTAGLRSVMNVGIGSMNRFTVAHTTRGIAALIKAEGKEARGVVIAHDSRNNSREFATFKFYETAELAAWAKRCAKSKDIALKDDHVS